MYYEKPTEITIINTENSEICNSVFSSYLPNSIIVTVATPEQLESLKKFPFFEGKSFEEKTSAFVCKNFTCSLPLHTIDEINSAL